MGERLCARPTVLSNKHIEDPERVQTIYASLTLSGSAQSDSYSVGFAQSRSPTAINFGPGGTKNLLKKHEVVCLLHQLPYKSLILFIRDYLGPFLRIDKLKFVGH